MVGTASSKQIIALQKPVTNQELIKSWKNRAMEKSMEKLSMHNMYIKER